MQDDQSYDTVQDFMTPHYVGEQTDENLRAAKDLNDPLSSDATESEPIDGQSGYGSVDTSSEDVNTLNQSDIGGVPGEASVVEVRKSWIPVSPLTSTPKLQFNEKQLREARKLGDYNTAATKQIALSVLPP